MHIPTPFNLNEHWSERLKSYNFELIDQPAKSILHYQQSLASGKNFLQLNSMPTAKILLRNKTV